ncbi:MAG: MBL fold metallo-hydrolase [Candidatus Hodarchaeales archaeon]
MSHELIEFLPQHWYIRHPILAHTFFWENSDGTVTIFDSGTSKKDAQWTINSIMGLGYTQRQIKEIIVSHCHPDHIGGIHYLQRYFHAKIISHRVEKRYLERPHSLDNRSLKGLARWAFLPLFYFYDSRPVFVQKEVTTSTKNRFLEFIHMPGHTLGSLAVLIKSSGLILTGDALYTGRNGHISYSPPVFSIDPVMEKKSVEKLFTDYEFDYMASSHGFPIDKAKKRLEKFLFK